MDSQTLLNELLSKGYSLSDIYRVSEEIGQPLSLSALSILARGKRSGNLLTFKKILRIHKKMMG